MLTSVLGPSHLQRGSLSHFITGIRKRPLFLSAFPNSVKGLVFIPFQPSDKDYSCTADNKRVELLKSAQGPHTPAIQTQSHLSSCSPCNQQSPPSQKSLCNIPPTRTRTPLITASVSFPSFWASWVNEPAASLHHRLSRNQREQSHRGSLHPAGGPGEPKVSLPSQSLLEH